MSRWGEEDKRGKGIFGCLFAFAVLGLSLYTFLINYQALEGRRLLEKTMQSIVRNGYDKSEAQMIGELITFIEEEELDVSPEDIELSKTVDKYNNPVVDVRIDFKIKVNLLVAQFDANWPIKENLVIVVF